MLVFSDKQTLGYIIALSWVGRGTRRLTGKNGNASRLGNPLLARRLIVRHDSFRLGLGIQDHLTVIPISLLSPFRCTARGPTAPSDRLGCSSEQRTLYTRPNRCYDAGGGGDGDGACVCAELSSYPDRPHEPTRAG